MTVAAESQDRNLTEKDMEPALTLGRDGYATSAWLRQSPYESAGMCGFLENTETPLFPIQKGSLNLLRQKWESSDYQRSEYCPGDTWCRLPQPRESKLLQTEPDIPLAPETPDPPSMACSPGEEMLSAETVEESPKDESEPSREYGQPEVLKEASLIGRRRIERFSIALDELRSVFEAPKCGSRLTGPAQYTGKRQFDHSHFSFKSGIFDDNGSLGNWFSNFFIVLA
ncbi:uncharacterized protein LOC125350869 [Perognathus longimembris pacificus]|uniref:uncharacterized protein LOC125350869 n=1 Tax=Perognathus longimembris pacificus TaxID=214514 RepID=UPI002019FAB7|nr:uncharacterized protein LOC125350869 [Perognathus longimembris pacificus]